MNTWSYDPGSFRDPQARVVIERERVLRAIFEQGAPAYRDARAVGVYEKLIERGLLLPFRELEKSEPALAGNCAHLLESPKLPFVSYPYEWSFALHRRAALCHLDLHLAALEHDFTLSDATAYNVQFDGTRPIFIDHMSLRRYREGEFWIGHRQFCMQFLNPLVFWSHLGVAPNAWFRGSLEGVTPEDCAKLLPWKSKLSLTTVTHVVAQAALQKRQLRRPGASEAPSREGRLPKTSFVGMLAGLRNYIAKLPPPKNRTVWSDYANSNSYAQDEAAIKRAFVGKMVRAVEPKLLFDLGCNTGDYSEISLGCGTGGVVGFDFDYGALDRAYDRFDKKRLPFLPLLLDAANPSPSQGWNQSERKGFKERASADALIALALLHHIAIARNVPLADAVNWILDLAPKGIVEFVPKGDPMVQNLVANREDIFSDYNENVFWAAINARARVVASERVSRDGRLLVWYDRD